MTIVCKEHLEPRPALQPGRGCRTASLSTLSSGMLRDAQGIEPVGAAMSRKLRHQIARLSVAERTTADTWKLLDLASDAMSRVLDHLARLREIAHDASDGEIDPTKRGSLAERFCEARNLIDEIVSTTRFGDTPLLDGTVSLVKVQAGIAANTNDRVLLSFRDLRCERLGATTPVSLLAVDSAALAQAAATDIDAALAQVVSERARITALQSRLSITAANLASSRASLAVNRQPSSRGSPKSRKTSNAALRQPGGA